MARRELDAFGRHQMEKRIMPRRHGAMHRLDHAFVLLRAGHRENIRIARRDRVGLGAHASGHDHLAVASERFPDRGERLRLGAVEKAAGIDDGEIGAFMGAGEFISFGAGKSFTVGSGMRDDVMAAPFNCKETGVLPASRLEPESKVRAYRAA